MIFQKGLSGCKSFERLFLYNKRKKGRIAMNRSFIQIILLSVKRRKRSLRKVGLISFLCVFLFAGIMIFQDCMNRFQREDAFLRSGEWILSASGDSQSIKEHAWIDYAGSIQSKVLCYSVRENLEQIKEEGWLGTADKDFRKLSHIEMYSGNMPENPDEIAITQHVLSDMGYSYELGQKIQIQYTDGSYDDSGKLVYYPLEYTLTGIVKNYTSDWVEEIEQLPEFFTTKQGLEQITHAKEGKEWYFYHLNRKNYEIQGEKFYESMKTLVGDNPEERFYQVVYNTKAYEVTMWGNKTMYLIMMIFLGTLGSMSLIYLFLSCCNNRRPYYFKLREIGADSVQIRKMVCVEWGAVFFPAAFLGLIAATLIAVPVAWGISRYFGIAFIFHLTKESIGMILLFTSGVFLIVMLWTCLFFRVKNLHEMTGQISLKRLKRMYRKGDKKSTPVSLFLRRQKRTEPGKTVAHTLFIIATMTIFLYSLYMIENAYDKYQESEKRVDVSASVLGDGKSVANDGYTITEDGKVEESQIVKLVEVGNGDTALNNGFSKETVQEILDFSSVDHVEGIIYDGSHCLWWNGQEKSTFRNNWYLKNYVEDTVKSCLEDLTQMQDEENGKSNYNQVFSYIYPKAVMEDAEDKGSLYQERMYGLQKNEKLENVLKEIFGEAFQSEAFWAGEQSILFELAPIGEEDDSSYPGMRWESPRKLPLQGEMTYDKEKQMYRFDCEYGKDYNYSYSENTLKSGDFIEIRKISGDTDSKKNKEDIRYKTITKTKVLLCQDEEKFTKICTALGNRQLAWTARDIVDGFFNGGTYLFASEELMQHIADIENTECKYNTLGINITENADSKETESRIADILSQQECEFQSNIQDKTVIRADFYKQFIMFGIMIILTISTYVFICQSMQQKALELSKGRLQLLLQMGCDRSVLWQKYAIAKLEENLWSVLGLPLCLFAILLGSALQYIKECKENFSEIDQVYLTETMIDITIALSRNGILWIGFLTFFFLGVLSCIYFQKKQLQQIKFMSNEE